MSPAKLLGWWLIAVWTIVDPSFHQRCAAARSPEVARRGILVSIACWALFDLMTTTAGLYARAALPALVHPTLAFPLLADAVLPPVARGVFFAGISASLFAALQGTALIAAACLGKGRVRAGLIATMILSYALSRLVPSVVGLWYAVGSAMIPGLLLPMLGVYLPSIRVPGRWAVASSAAGSLISLAWVAAARIIGTPPLGVEPMFPGLLLSGAVWAAARLRRNLGALVLTAAFASSACRTPARPSENPSTAPRMPPNINVMIDPRVQLLTMVQALADDGPRSAGSEALKIHFSAFRRHPAVLRYAAWRRAGISAVAPMQALLLASTGYVLEVPAERDGWASASLGGPAAVRAFISELSELNAASGFEAYFQSQGEANGRSVDEFLAELGRGIPIEALGAYLGGGYHGFYRLIPAPDYRSKGARTATRRSPASVTSVRIRNPGRWCLIKPCPAAGYGLARIGLSLPHELTHAIARPPKADADRLEAAIGPPPAACFSAASERGWRNCLDEHVAMAVEHRLLELTGVAARHPGAQEEFNEASFPYLPAVLDALRDYESQRSRYPTLESFYPRIIDAMIAAGRK